MTYLGMTRRVTKRKPARCKHCEKNGVAGGEERIQPGDDGIVVVRVARSKKGKTYNWTLYLHPDCFAPWSERMKKERAEYARDHKGGRPSVSIVSTLSEEQIQTRHKYIRDRARFLRYLLVTDDGERRANLSKRIRELHKQIEKILPLRNRGRRTRADGEELAKRLR